MVYVFFQEASLKDGATQIEFHNNVVYSIEVYITLHNTQISRSLQHFYRY